VGGGGAVDASAGITTVKSGGSSGNGAYSVGFRFLSDGVDFLGLVFM
jgi:hypothetical protein